MGKQGYKDEERKATFFDRNWRVFSQGKILRVAVRTKYNRDDITVKLTKILFTQKKRTRPKPISNNLMARNLQLQSNS